MGFISKIIDFFTPDKEEEVAQVEDFASTQPVELDLRTFEESQGSKFSGISSDIDFKEPDFNKFSGADFSGVGFENFGLDISSFGSRPEDILKINAPDRISALDFDLDREDRLNKLLKQAGFDPAVKADLDEKEQEELATLSEEFSEILNADRRKDILLKDKKVSFKGQEVKTLTTAKSAWHDFLGTLASGAESVGTGLKTLGVKADRRLREKGVIDKEGGQIGAVKFSDLPDISLSGVGMIGENMEQYYGDKSAVQEMKTVPDEFLGAGGKIASTVAKTVGSTIPNLIATIGTGGTGGAAQAYLEGSGDLYSTAQEIYSQQTGKPISKFTDDETDLLLKASKEGGVVVAGTTWLANKIGLGKTLAPFKRALVKEAVEEVFKESEGKILKEFSKGYVKSVASETVEEVTQEASKNIILKINEIDPDRKVNENLVETAVQTVIGVGLSFGLLEGAASARVDTNKTKEALSAVPEKALDMPSDEGEIIAVQDTENNAVTLKEVNPEVFEKEGKLIESFVETKSSDITLKLADIVGGKDARKYQNEIEGKEFANYEEFVNYSQEKVSEIIATKPALQSVASQMANVIIGDSDKVNVTSVKPLPDNSVKPNLTEDLLQSDKDNVKEITDNRFKDPIKTNVATSIAASVSEKIEEPSKKEMPTPLPKLAVANQAELKESYGKSVKTEEKPDYLSKSTKKEEDALYEGQKYLAASRAAYDQLTVEAPRDLSPELNKLSYDKSRGDLEAEAKKELSGREISLMKAEINSLYDRVKNLEKETDVILNEKVQILKAVQIELNGDLKNAPGWYNNFYRNNGRNATNEEIITLAEKEIKREANDDTLSREGRNSKEKDYISMENSKNTFETIIDSYEKLLSAKDNRVARYIVLANSLGEITKTENKLKTSVRESGEITNYDARIKLATELQPTEINDAFKHLSPAQKELYKSSTEAFTDSIKDPYVVKYVTTNKAGASTTRNKFVEGSKIDNYKDNEVAFRMSDESENSGFDNVSDYFNEMTNNDKSIKALKEDRNNTREQLLRTPEYIELLKRKQSIVDRMDMITSSYKDSVSLVKAVRFAQLKIMRDVVKNNVKTEFSNIKRKVKSTEKRLYTEQVQQKRERNAILNSYIKEYGSLGKSMVDSFKLRYSTKLGKESNLYTMSDSRFEKLMAEKFDPVIEKRYEVTTLVNSINILTFNNNLKNVSDLRAAFGLPKLPATYKQLTARDLEKLQVPELELYMELLLRFEENTEFLPKNILQKQLKNWSKDDTKKITEAEIFFSKEEWIKDSAKQAGISLTAAKKQFDSMQKKGFNVLDRMTGTGLVGIKDIYTNAISLKLFGIDNEIKNKTIQEQNVLNQKLREAIKSRRRSDSVDRRIDTRVLISDFMDAPQNKKDIYLEQMTEIEQDFALWAREYYDEKGRMLQKLDDMLLMNNYLTVIKPKMSELIKKHKMNVFKAVGEYWKTDNMIKNSKEWDDFAADYGFLSSTDHFKFSKQRNDALEGSRDIGQIMSSYINEVNRHIVMSRELPSIASSVDILATGASKEKNIRKFWKERIDAFKGIKPELALGLKQGGDLEGAIKTIDSFFTMSILAFKPIHQFMSIGGEFFQILNQVGVIKTTQSAITGFRLNANKMAKLVGFKPNSKQLDNIQKIIDDNTGVLGRTLIDDLRQVDNDIVEKSRLLIWSGYALTTQVSNRLHFVSMLNKQEIEQGFVTPKRTAEIVSKMSEVRKVSDTSKSPIGKTNRAKVWNKFAEWALYNVFHTLNTGKKTGMKIADTFRKVQKNEHVNWKDVGADYMVLARSAGSVYLITQVLKGLVEQDWLPEDPEDDDYVQAKLRRLLQDSISAAGSFLTLANKYYNLYDSLTTYAFNAKADENPFDFVTDSEKSEMEEFISMFGMRSIDSSGKTNIFLTDQILYISQGIIGNVYKTYNPETTLPDKEEAEDKYKYNLYKQIPTIFRDAMSVVGMQPGFVTATKEERKLSKELLGHTFGLNDNEKIAADLYAKQKNMSNEEVAAQIQTLTSSDDIDNQRQGKALILFYANKDFNNDEKEFLSSLTSFDLTKQQKNNGGTQAIALAQYLQNIEDDDERQDFVERLNEKHISFGLVSKKVLDEAFYFYSNDIQLDGKESRFYTIYTAGGDRGEAIAQHLIDMDLNRDEMTRQLNIYSKAGMINEETSQAVVKKLIKDKGINLSVE